MSDLKKSIHNSKIHIVLNFFFILSKMVSVFQNFRVFLNFRILDIFYQITRKYAYFGVYMRLKSFFYLFLYHKKPIWVSHLSIVFWFKWTTEIFLKFSFFENWTKFEIFRKMSKNFFPIFRKWKFLKNFCGLFKPKNNTQMGFLWYKNK